MLRLLVLAFLLATLPPPATAAADPAPRVTALEREVDRLKAEVERLKADVKSEPASVEKLLTARVEDLKGRIDQQNAHMDHMLAGLGAVLGGLALWGLITGFLSFGFARQKAREAAREEIKTTKDDIVAEALRMVEEMRADALRQLQGAHMRAEAELTAFRDAATARIEAAIPELQAYGQQKMDDTVADLMRNFTPPASWTEEQRAAVQASARTAATTPAGKRSAKEWRALAMLAMEQGKTDEAAEYLDHATRDGADDPWTWITLSRLRRMQGNAPEALVTAEQAKTLSIAQGKERDLAVALNEVGDSALAISDLPRALESYKESFNIISKLHAASPNNRQLTHDALLGNLRIADANIQWNRLDISRQHLLAAKTIARHLIESLPDNPTCQRELSVVYDRFGDLHFAEGQMKEAAKALRIARKISLELLNSDTRHPLWRLDLAENDGKLGDVAAALGRADEACGHWEEAVAGFDALAAEGKLDAYGRKLLDRYRAKIVGGCGKAAEFAGT